MTAQDVPFRVERVEEQPLPFFVVELETRSELGPIAAGQFVMVQTAPGVDPLLRRAFSVFDHERDGDVTRIKLLGKVIGSGTAALASRRAGDTVRVLGPLGNSFSLPSDGRAMLVAGGVGSAALLLLIQELASRGVACDFFYGGRSVNELACRTEFAHFSEKSGGRFVATTDDGSFGEEGWVTGPVERALGEVDYQIAYTCGPHPLMAKLASMTAEHSVPLEAALETPMGCGFGACLGCVVPRPDGTLALCCKDGPIFPAGGVAW